MSSVNVKTDVKATAVVLGGTGLIGLFISKCLLTEYRAAFPTVRITTRDVNSPAARDLAALGAEVHSFNDPLADVLTGADVVVNAMPPHISDEDRKKTTAAIAATSSVKVYFMSEFGVDYALNDFPGFEHHEWPLKRVITAESNAAMGDRVKIIALMVGVFLGTYNSPYSQYLGVDIKKNTYKTLGDPNARFSVTAEVDIARSVAQLSVLSLDPATAATVPSGVRVQSTTISYADLAAAVARVRSVPQSEVVSEDLKAFKDGLKANPSDNIFDYLRVLIGEGKIDFSSRNHNELINPGQSIWKWKTLEEQIREVA